MDTDENGNLVVHTHQAVHVKSKLQPAQKTVISNTGIALTVAATSADAALTTEITSGDTVVKAGHQAEKVEAKPANRNRSGQYILVLRSLRQIFQR